MDNKWRFPDNGYTTESGLDDSEMEMFKKDPVASLAREICQNSIDASSGGEPVKVVFSSFEVSRDEVPGIDDLSKEINSCYNFKKDSEKEGPALYNMKQCVEQNIIKCLRISDYNTTGVRGVDYYKSGAPFYSLTKGSGVSDKGVNSAGSKGIGKFASFVVSQINTVFYSTYADDNGKGYLGISKLRSVPLVGEDEDLMTMGIGYFGADKKNSPVKEELHLDPSYTRGDEHGTDVYVLGFVTYNGWENDIIAEVVKSFMVAMMHGDLILEVNGVEVNRETMESIIYDDSFCAGLGVRNIREIQAQFEMLRGGENVAIREIDVEGSQITIYVKKYTQIDERKATKHCLMVRHPFMMIKTKTTNAMLPYSALCIIHESDLNEKLRKIENPQHTDWEIKRLNDFPEEKKETSRLKRIMEDTISSYIREVLAEGSSETTDMEGAGEFLPSTNEELGVAVGKGSSGEEIVVNPIVQVVVPNPKTIKAGEAGEGYEFDKGEQMDDGTEGREPAKKEKKPNPNPEPKVEPGDGKKYGEGDRPVLKKVPLSGMKYHTIITDKKAGKFKCAFTSIYDELDCEMQIRMCGDSRDKFAVNILSAEIDGEPCDIVDGKIVGLTLEKNKNYQVLCVVDNNQQFASEVIFNANR